MKFKIQKKIADEYLYNYQKNINDYLNILAGNSTFWKLIDNTLKQTFLSLLPPSSSTSQQFYYGLIPTENKKTGISFWRKK